MFISSQLYTIISTVLVSSGAELSTPSSHDHTVLEESHCMMSMMCSDWRGVILYNLRF